MAIELCSVLNDRKARLRWLTRAYEERSTQWPYLPLHKDYYKGDPEAEALVARRR